jgi:hypothetical protein
LIRVFNVPKTYRESSEVWRTLIMERKNVESDCTVDASILVARITLRLSIALLFSELCGTYFLAPILSVVAQFRPGGTWLDGVLAGIAGDYFGAVFSFWFAWLLLNSGYYMERGRPHPLRFANDLWFLHACALLASILLYAGDIAVSVAAVWLLSFTESSAAEYTPVIFWFAFGNGLFEALFLGAAAGFLPAAAERIVPSYRAYLQRVYPD